MLLLTVAEIRKSKEFSVGYNIILVAHRACCDFAFGSYRFTYPDY
jgi:hypothetical protein